jgi:hypothetical protein
MRKDRFARTGTICLGAFVLWMVAGRALLFRAGARPPLLLVGSAVVRDTLDLWGYAAGAFRLALSWLWVAVGLWAVTAGFRSGPRWLPPVRLAIGLAGLAAVAPCWSPRWWPPSTSPSGCCSSPWSCCWSWPCSSGS